jgi:hypothetical protein
MTVAELIRQLQDLCEDRDPSTVEIKKVVSLPDQVFWGEDWEDFYLDAAGGNEYPFVVLIK